MKKKIVGIYPWVAELNKNSDKHQLLFSKVLQNKGYEIKKIIYKKGLPISNALRTNVDILILDWVHSFYTSQSAFYTLAKSFLGLFDLYIMPKKDTKIIWNLHNLQRHDGKFKIIEKFCFQQLAQKVDYIRVFDKSHVIKVSNHLKVNSKKIIVIPQGPYLFEKNTDVDLYGRYKIAKNKKVLLFFGSVREGKGLLEFLHSYQKTELKDWILLIAGKSIEEDIKNKVEEFVINNSNIIFDNRYIPDEEVKSYFENVSRLLLPYVNTLNSGILLLGKIYNTPILANSNFKELLGENDVVGNLFSASDLKVLLKKSSNKSEYKNISDIATWDDIVQLFIKMINEK